MRHRASGRKLGRTTTHRKAMFRNQLTSFFTHERIVTTLCKAKELRPLAEHMVTLARSTGDKSLPARRRILRTVSDKEVVRRLFDDIAPRFAERPGGYTRILRLGRRHGDGAQLAILEFVDYKLKPKKEEAPEESKTSLMDRAKRALGGGRKKAAEGEPEEAAAPVKAQAAEAESEEPAAEETPAK